MQPPIASPRIPGTLNSKDLLIAEAVHARAWALVGSDEAASSAKARLGHIVVSLMSSGTVTGDVSVEAARIFLGTSSAAGN